MNTRARHLLRIICLVLLWPASAAAQSPFLEVAEFDAGLPAPPFPDAR